MCFQMQDIGCMWTTLMGFCSFWLHSCVMPWHEMCGLCSRAVQCSGVYLQISC